MTTKITCSIGTTDPSAKLGLEIWINDKKLLDLLELSEDFKFSYDIPEEEGDHELRFVMKNKTQEHTEIDDAGNITKDASLTVSNLAFDDIELKHLFLDKAVYTHNFNGSQDEIKDKFFGVMGCNGAVSLTFSTPIYIWLLENM
jgi:hypothetical protein